MGLAQTDTLHFNSFKEFLEFEKHSEIRYEFHNGEVFAMAGTTLIHNELVDNVKDLLKATFRPKGCKVYSESIKLQAIKDYYYPYPDVMLTCHELDKQERYIIKNPMLIVEVLSMLLGSRPRPAPFQGSHGRRPTRGRLKQYSWSATHGAPGAPR